MANNNESFYNNLLLDNIDISIPLVKTTETPKRPIPEKNASKSSSSGISIIEKNISPKKYDEAALNQLKQELLTEVKQHINNIQNNNYLGDYIKSLHDQIESLKNEVLFLRKELSGKNETIKILVDSVSRKETENITTDIQYNTEERENKITNELNDAATHLKQSNEDNESIPKNSSDQDSIRNLQQRTEMPDKSNSNLEKKNIYILGDSMVKHVYGWEMNQKLSNKHKVFVRSFSGAKTNCMRDYIKPCLRENSPEHVVLHVGTNDLPSEKPADTIAKSIINLAQEVEAKGQSVSVSSIIPRNDKWNNKVFEVNSCLKKLCDNAKIDYLDNSININPRRHLNNSKLHLNTKGSGKLLQNFVTLIKKKFSA